MEQSYPQLREHLQSLTGRLGQQIPGVMKGFGQLHDEATAEGTLSTRHKELTALGIAISVRCDGCIAFHVHEALAAGATSSEVVECIGVAIMMGGGPAVVYGAQALDALEQFRSAQVT